MIGKSGPVLATAVTVGSGRFCALLLPRLHLLSLPTFRSCCVRFEDRMSIVARCVYPRFFSMAERRQEKYTVGARVWSNTKFLVALTSFCSCCCMFRPFSVANYG